MYVFLNPGHCPGIDSGAMNGAFTEAEIALSLGEKARRFLQKAGVTVTLLQSDNLAGESPYDLWDAPDMPEVCGCANQSGADIFVSIHLNAAENRSARGTDVLVYQAGGRAERLAEYALTQLVDTGRTWNGDWLSRGVKERPDLAVLRETIMPAILIEVGFLSNDAELAEILAHETEIAAAIARACTDYEQEFLGT